MNNFWAGIEGTEEAAFQGFAAIPDNTHVVAEIKVVEYVQPQDREPLFECKWKVIDGDFKNKHIFQKIRCFDADESKAVKHKNILMLLFKTANVPVPQGAPTINDLALFQGRICNLKIGMMKGSDGKEYNFVRELHAADYTPQPTAHAHAASPVDSAFSRNEARQAQVGIPDDGLPF